MSEIVHIPHNHLRFSDFWLKKSPYRISSFEVQRFTVVFPSNAEDVTTALNLAVVGSIPRAFCSCEDFSEHRVCSHIPAALRLSKKEFKYRLRYATDAFIPVSSEDDVDIHDLFTFFKTKKKEADIFEGLPSKKIRKKNIDQLFYEFHPSHHALRIPPHILFYAAPRLKNERYGKAKQKKIKYHELDTLQDPIDVKIVNSLLPETCLFKNYSQVVSDSFNGAKITSKTATVFQDLLKSKRLFLYERIFDGEYSHMNFLTLNESKKCELKLVVDSLSLKMKLTLILDELEVIDASILFEAKLVFHKNVFYRLINYLPDDLIKQIGLYETISFSPSHFQILKEELLGAVDHRSIGGDCFGLPSVIVKTNSIAHVRLPMTEEGFFWACLEEVSPLVAPPFNHLSIYQDEQRNGYESFIREELDQELLEGNYFKIHQDDFEKFLKGAEKKHLKVVADKVLLKNISSFNLSLTHNLNWFEVSGKAVVDGVEIPLPEILKKVSIKDQFIEFKKGEKSFVPKKWLEKIKKLSETCDFIDGKFVAHESRALQLEALEVESVDLTRLVEKIRGFKSLPDVTPGDNFCGELRDYQKFSLKWMKFLRDIRLGGILADDMGLGKTVQVAANLGVRKTEKDFKRSPHLIVCPKSLVFNWKNELAKFTPNLKIEILETGKFDLKKLMKKSAPDVFLTTYGIVQRNCELFQKTSFDYIVLDEAQAIKNVRSLTAKAVFTLKGEHRLVLTGTPMENHVGELYSLFNFLMPGAYKRLAMNPDHSNKSQTQALKPFLLRRTKAQVLADLPEKVEQIIWCEQTSEEKDHYNKLKSYLASNLNKTVDMDNFRSSSILILEALTRMRQAACHPGLINPELQHLESGKMNTLREMLSEILQEGHKVIIFSQFTTLLKLVRKSLEMDDSNSCYLDGKSSKRENIVETFQNSQDKNVFFISLKAGGTGLNLTKASYCFILDPWWNPAVEAQAIGRLHRIGQKKSVNVYRLISRGTIEDKVLELQNLKSQIISEMISDETEGFMRSLSSKDLEFLLN